MRKEWTETNLGPLVTLRTGKLDVNAGVEEGEFPFFTCSRDTYKIDVAAYSGKSVIVAGNGDLNVKYYEGKFNAYQRTYILQAINESVLNPIFLFHFMEKYVDTLRNDTQGSTIQYLKKGQFTEAPIVLPPLVEQKRIVDVVSSVDTFIDALQQQAVIARTARNAVLHELLSAGGDDWTEASLGEVCRLVKGISYKSDELVAAGEGLPFINLKSIGRGGGFRPDGLKWFLGKHKEEQVVRTGDLVLCCTDLTKEKAILGYPLLVPKLVEGDEFCISLDMAVLIVDKNSSSNAFMYLVLQGSRMREFMTSHSSGTTVMHLQTRSVGDAKFSLPPIAEQRRIVDVVSSMDEVIQATEQAVIDAKNLRSGLLSDLLSGEHEIPASYDLLLGAA